MMDKWIKCSDQMPPDGKAEYLIVTARGDVWITDYCYEDDIGWCFCYDPDATHWMPLPSRPTNP